MNIGIEDNSHGLWSCKHLKHVMIPESLAVKILKKADKANFHFSKTDLCETINRFTGAYVFSLKWFEADSPSHFPFDTFIYAYNHSFSDNGSK